MNDAYFGGCFGKAGYQHRNEAKRVIARVLRRRARKPSWCGQAKLVAYKCRSCGQWHVGNDGKAGLDGY